MNHPPLSRKLNFKCPWLIIFLFTIIPVSVFSQHGKISTAPIATYTQVDRYLIDYEIQDVVAPSSELLLSLDLTSIENQRLMDTDVLINDTVHHITIILYSTQRAATNKRNAQPRVEPTNNESYE